MMCPMTQKMLTQLSERVRQLRKKQGLTQQSLAEKAGLSIAHVQRIERKKPLHNVNLETLQRLAKAFNITPSELINF